MARLLAHFDRNWILVAMLTVFAVAPLAYPGFFQAHSGFLPAFDAERLTDAPDHGMIDWGHVPDPVRGEGKLPYLLVRPFLALSGSGAVAIKWGFGLAFLLSALGAYAWTRRWLGKRGGVLAATIYTYLPWHLGTVYVRGAYAEAWLWAPLPFTLWAVDRLAERRPLATLAGAVVGLLALVASFLTQPGLSALSVLLLVTYGVILIAKRRGLLLRLVGASALVLIALWFVGRTAPETTFPFGDHFLYPFQLLSAAWGLGTSVPGWEDGMSFQLGLAAAGLSIVAVALWVSGRTMEAEGEDGEERAKESRSDTPTPSISPGRALGFWGLALLVLVFLTLRVSAFFWRITNLDDFLTYPWQVLALAGLPLAFLAGSVVRLDERLAKLPASAGLIALVVLASYPYLAPRFTRVDPGPEPVAIFQPVEADAPQIVLLDAEIAPLSQITPTLTLTLTWQAVDPVAKDYTVFAHVLTSDDTKAAQLDTQPCGGECPTHSWQPGEIITDRYQLTLPPDAPPGPYRLAIGLYLLDTGERAAVVGRDDRTVFLDVP